LCFRTLLFAAAIVAAVVTAVAAGVILAAAARVGGGDGDCGRQDQRQNQKGGAKETGHGKPPSTTELNGEVNTAHAVL
jgi:hypothetical protein